MVEVPAPGLRGGIAVDRLCIEGGKWSDRQGTKRRARDSLSTGNLALFLALAA